MSERIDPSFIQQVIDRTDIVDLIDRHVKLKRSGKNYTACCPFHQEKSPSFTVSADKQFYYCFGCGASGNALSFLTDYSRLDFMDALKQLAQSAGLEIPKPQGEQTNRLPRSSDTRAMLETLQRVSALYQQQLREHPERNKAVAYLKQRGVSGAIARDFLIGYAPPGWSFLSNQKWTTLEQQHLIRCGLLIERKNQTDSFYDALRDRIIFPIRNSQGKVIGFGGRVLNDEKPKYLNSPESPVFQKGQELYGLFEARSASRLEQLLVVEGYLDVIALAQHGIHCAVATLGTATTTQHILKMFRSVDRVLFCFDGDTAGRNAAWKAVQAILPALHDERQIGFVFLPDGEDPDTLIRKEGPGRFAERLTSFEPFSDFLFRHESEELDLTRLEDRSRLVNKIRPLLEQIPEGIYRQLLWQRLEQNAGLAHIETKPIQQPPQQPPQQLSPQPVAANPVRQRPRNPTKQAPRVTLSLCDQALRTLLLYPASHVRLVLPDPAHGHLFHGLDMLYEVYQTVIENPDLNTPALLGYWHGTALGDQLAQLAATDTGPGEQKPEQLMHALSIRFQTQLLLQELQTIKENLKDTPSKDLVQKQINLHAELNRLKAELQSFD